MTTTSGSVTPMPKEKPVSPLSRPVEKGGVEFQLNIVWKDETWDHWLPGTEGPGWVWQAEPPPGWGGFGSCRPHATEEEALEDGLKGVERLGPRPKPKPEE
mgnify:CR=1 FL=1